MGLRPFFNGMASVLASRSSVDSNMGRIMSTSAHPGRFFVGTGPLEINDKNRGGGVDLFQ